MRHGTAKAAGHARSAATDAEPTAPATPPFGWRLTETPVADVLTYIWDNAAPAVAPTTVRSLRTPLEARHE